MEKYYTIAEIKESWKISEVTIRRYIKEGRLKSQRIGRQYRLSETNIKDFLNTQNKKRRLRTMDKNNNDILIVQGIMELLLSRENLLISDVI